MVVTEPKTHPATALEATFLIPYYRSLKLHGELFNLRAQRVSMLHEDVLAILYHLARNTKGAVLELGPYVGGSTTALGWGKRDSALTGPIISVELGGTYEHPTHGTDDIVRDLKANLARFEVASMVTVVVGNSRDPRTVQAVREGLKGAKVGVFFVDSDGNVAADLALYGDLLASGCYLMFDDYFAPGAPDKVGPTQDAIATLQAQGLVEPLGIYGWGTWLGRLR
jgi:predicted O-methyltransferase YrrM